MKTLGCFISANFVHYCVLFSLLSIKMSALRWFFPAHSQLLCKLCSGPRQREELIALSLSPSTSKTMRDSALPQPNLLCTISPCANALFSPKTEDRILQLMDPAPSIALQATIWMEKWILHCQQT